MSDLSRSYITTSVRDRDLQHFHGRIQQYDVLTSAEDLDIFMRQCVSNRFLHDMPILQGPDGDPQDDSPGCDVLLIGEYQMSDSNDDVLVHPVDEIAMDDISVSSWSRGEESKAIFITEFLGPRAQWPLVLLWRPESERLGFCLPHLPADPDDLDEQENGPLVFWAQVLGKLKQDRRLAMEPERSWRPGDGREDFGKIFMMLVQFFSGQRVYGEAEGDEQVAWDEDGGT